MSRHPNHPIGVNGAGCFYQIAGCADNPQFRLQVKFNRRLINGSISCFDFNEPQSIGYRGG